MSSVLAVVAVDSSGGSDESEPLPVDFWGDPFFVKARVVRSARPDALEAEEECCDCGWVVRAREDRRVGEVPAICFERHKVVLYCSSNWPRTSWERRECGRSSD